MTTNIKKSLYAVGALSALGSLSSLFAFTATFNADNTNFDWNDASIWDTVPNASGAISIIGTGTTGSTLQMSGVDMSAYMNNTKITDAALYIKDSSSINFGHNPGSLTLVGSSYVSVLNSQIAFGTFNSIVASGTSTFYAGAGSTFGGTYSQFRFTDSASMIIDNTSYLKTSWNDASQLDTRATIWTDNSSLTLKNAATFGFSGTWGDTNINFEKNATINVESGSKFQLGPDTLVLKDNAVLNIKDEGSSVTATAIKLNGASKINVSDGASVGLNNVTIDDTASVNFLSNFNYSQTTLNASGTSATINVNGVAMTRTGNTITVGGSTKLNYTNGATLVAGHGAGLALADNTVVTFDNSTLNLGNFSVVTATGGSLVFKNNSSFAGSGFGSYIFSGASSMTFSGSNTNMAADFYANNPDLYALNFTGTSSFNVLDGATFSDKSGFHHGNFKLGENAQMNISGDSTFVWSVDTSTRKFDVTDSAVINIASGANSASFGVFSMASGTKLNISGSENLVVAKTSSVAGEIHFISDAVNVSTFDGGEILDFTGKIFVDMSELTTVGLTETSLITSSAEWDETNYITDVNNAFVNVTKANEADTWSISQVGNELVIAYNHVPEPSTYAAIFGALALGLAAMRRRAKRN